MVITFVTENWQLDLKPVDCRGRNPKHTDIQKFFLTEIMMGDYKIGSVLPVSEDTFLIMREFLGNDHGYSCHIA